MTVMVIEVDQEVPRERIAALEQEEDIAKSNLPVSGRIGGSKDMYRSLEEICKEAAATGCSFWELIPKR